MKSIPDILKSLGEAGVQFVLVGGFAVQLYGFVRTTLDLDIVLAMDDANLRCFIDVAKRHGLAPVIPVPIESLADAAKIDEWYRERRMLAFALREEHSGGSVVDVLVRPEVPFEQLLSRAVDVALFGRPLKVASINDLLTMKRSADRPKDRIDVEALLKIQRGEDPHG